MKIFFTFLLFVGTYVTSYAQAPNPVHWSFCIKKMTNNEAEIIMTAKIDKGYHLWSTNPGHADLIPTAIVFKKADFFEIIGNIREEGKMVKEDMTKIDLGIVNYYDNTVKFIQKIKLKKKGKIEFSIEYQTCSHEGCLPPRVDEFSIETESPCKASLSPRFKPTNALKPIFCTGKESETNLKINRGTANNDFPVWSNNTVTCCIRNKAMKLESTAAIAEAFVI